jgi:uncharacterized RDD family membrane protein YckC
LAAHGADILIAGLLWAVVGAVAMIAASLIGGLAFRAAVHGNLAATAVGALPPLAWNGYLLHRYGQSVGKRILRIMVVRADGRRASVARLIGLRGLLQAVVWLVPVVGPLLAVADSLFIFSRDRRCIHDHLAGTAVIDVPPGFQGYW